MEEDVAEIARKMRRTAKSAGRDADDPVTRRLGGWKLVLSYGRKGGPELEAEAERFVAEKFGQEFVDRAKKTAPKPGPLDAFIFRWHLSASWANSPGSNGPTARDKQRLADLVVALGVPEVARAGDQPMAVMQTTPQGTMMQSIVTHWRWDEPIEAKA
jgi:hypothetical protein